MYQCWNISQLRIGDSDGFAGVTTLVGQGMGPVVDGDIPGVEK